MLFKTLTLTAIIISFVSSAYACDHKKHACSSAKTIAKSKNSPHQSTKKISPFLIPSGMPHMTKLLKQQWNSQDLNLSNSQKQKLLVVRQTTMKAVKSIAPRIKGLQKTIVRKAMANETPEVLEPMVKKLAQLKAKATNVHIRCIYDTAKILTKAQLAHLSK
ncbi:MAG: hypothetical protein DSZ03_00605 [Sulfurimonas sp.]|nr:MAG: hypothetical protein DSZ03_00605 [Sulfurimonas sp.]